MLNGCRMGVERVSSVVCPKRAQHIEVQWVICYTECQMSNDIEKFPKNLQDKTFISWWFGNYLLNCEIDLGTGEVTLDDDIWYAK